MIAVTGTTVPADGPVDEEDAPRPDVEAARPEGRVCRIECRTCGFEPAAQRAVPRCPCPKCHSTTWVRFVRSDVIRTVGRRWDYSKLGRRDRPALRCSLPIG